MKLDHFFADELTALASEVKSIKLINSCLELFNLDLATEINLPDEWQDETHLFGAIFTEHGALNRDCIAKLFSSASQRPSRKGELRDVSSVHWCIKKTIRRC